MPVPAHIVDMAMTTLDDEVKRWRKIPYSHDTVVLQRMTPMSDMVMASAAYAETATIDRHFVAKHLADDLIVRTAMERVLQAALGNITRQDAARIASRFGEDQRPGSVAA